MDPLRVEALGSAVLNVPRLPLVIPKPQAEAQAAAVTAQAPVQPAATAILQATTGPAVPASSLTQDFTNALLAALTPPQAAAAPTAAASATATDSGTATPIPATAAATVTAEALLTPAALENGASGDFALLTALRFGAGVAPLGTPALNVTDLGATLVRDAAAVPRLPNLQPQPGRPGPEDFARLLQAQSPQALQAYRTPPAPPTATGLDLLA
ncbi:MAG TPA: hypothetical protein VF804_13815 [Holophagaceae bacterium]